MTEALERGAMFNIYHRPSGRKVDIYLAKSRFHHEQLQRPVPRPVEGITLPVASAEDILIAKLHWYRLGNEVSDRQWTDICGILAARRDVLDMDYVRRWCEEFRVTDLLERALISVETGE
ncbi:MAG TPA: hypothetical protein VFL57_07070 [Bryobacteraceae bacterium]|nr:hypothetical protein [Bryobacteraceae bacterium]